MAGDVKTLDGPRVLAPFGALAVTEDDYLRISVLGAGTQLVRVTGRMLQYDGEVKTFDRQLAAPASRVAPATIIVKTGCGWLQNVTAIALTAGTGLAQTFVTVDLVRGPDGNGGVMATLIQGFVSSLTRRAWPGSPIQSSLEGPGVIRTITGTNAPAGADIVEVVPTGVRWRLLTFTATLFTSATVATRGPALQLRDAAAAELWRGGAATQPASTTLRHSFAQGIAQQGATVNGAFGPIPNDIRLLAGFAIATVTLNIDATDDWNAPIFSVEEWLEGA